MYKFRDVNNASVVTPLQDAFPSYLAIASKVPYILFLGVNTAISGRYVCTTWYVLRTVKPRYKQLGKKSRIS